MTDKQIRPFADWLTEQRGGITHTELSEALNAVAEGVLEHGKAGSVTLVVTVKPAGTADHQVVVLDDVKVKVPVGTRPSSLYFVSEDANLTRSDPRQPMLPLREVERPAKDAAGA